MPLPWSLLVARLVLRNLLMLAHNMAIVVVVLVIFRVWPGMPLLILPATLALVVVLLTMASLFLAVIGARFRDMAPIVQNGLQVAFFVTPILWMPEALSAGRAAFTWLIDYNPFHHVLEIVRRPLLGEWPTLINLGVVLGLTVVMTALALAVFARGRSRIIFWC
jgi:ABC-type polysaccharide/polyol phosphate export permease